MGDKWNHKWTLATSCPSSGHWQIHGLYLMDISNKKTKLCGHQQQKDKIVWTSATKDKIVWTSAIIPSYRLSIIAHASHTYSIIPSTFIWWLSYPHHDQHECAWLHRLEHACRSLVSNTMYVVNSIQREVQQHMHHDPYYTFAYAICSTIVTAIINSRYHDVGYLWVRMPIHFRAISHERTYVHVQPHMITKEGKYDHGCWECHRVMLWVIACFWSYMSDYNLSTCYRPLICTPRLYGAPYHRLPNGQKTKEK